MVSRTKTRVSYLLLTFITLWTTSTALQDCNPNYVQVESNQQKSVYSPNYSGAFTVPSSCQVKVAAPLYHTLQGWCSFNMGGTSTCDPNDSLYVQTDGTIDLTNPNVRYYCGSNQNVSISSIYNSITVGYRATYYSGRWTCSFRAVPQTGCDCGNRLTTRIVGGEHAPVNGFPYMAVILQKDNNAVKGGAVIISTNVAMTAAHVFVINGQWANSNTLTCSVARDNLGKSVQTDTPYSQNYDFTYRTHPDYNDATGENDIALMYMTTYYNFNRAVSPICLPGPADPITAYDNKRITEMGFGTVDYGGAYPNYFKTANAYMMPNNQCANYYGSDVNAKTACTYSTDRNDTCQGDSGGPIVMSEFSRDFAIGVVVSGAYCGRPNFPAVVTRVSPYRDTFIRRNIDSSNYLCLYKG